jgi:hypothetical protein
MMAAPNLALSFPGPFEILLLFLFLAVPAAVILVVMRAGARPQRPSAFPVLPTSEADGPGSYRVVGVDRNTRADRDLVIEAQSRENARVKAELDGIVVTAVTKKA